MLREHRDGPESQEPFMENVVPIGSVPKKILIVEDNQLNLKLLNDILEFHGYTIFATRFGEEAPSLARQHEPDLILMDVHMPHLNGIEATRYIKQFKNPPLVIIVTSDDTPDSRALAKRAGADGFVTKTGQLHAQLKVIFRQLFSAHYKTCPIQ